MRAFNDFLMLPEVESWKNETLQRIAAKGQQYDAKDRESLKIDFLERALLHVAPLIQYFADLELFRKAFDACIERIPAHKDVKLAEHNAYLKQIGKLQKALKSKYNLIPKNYFIRLWIPLGVAIGAGWGVAFKNIGLGMGTGIALGVAIGVSFDRKAQKEGRVI